MSSASSIVREARRAAGLTQAQLAERLRTSQASVAQLERPGANPTFDRLEAAVHAAGHRLEVAAKPHASNIDESLIARNLRMTPAQRLAAFETAHREVEALRALMPDAG